MRYSIEPCFSRIRASFHFNYMARKAKKKVVKKKVVSQKPRKAHSRPVWAMLLFTIAVLFAVSIFDYEHNQVHNTLCSSPRHLSETTCTIYLCTYHVQLTCTERQTNRQTDKTQYQHQSCHTKPYLRKHKKVKRKDVDGKKRSAQERKERSK